MEFLLIPIIALLGWGLKLIRTDLKFLEDENAELRKSNVKALSSVVVRLAQCFDLKLTKTSTKQIIN